MSPFRGEKPAAENAIAFAYAHRALLGDNHERAGWLTESSKGSGIFTSSFKVGSVGAKGMKVVSKGAVAPGQPFVASRPDKSGLSTAYWHIHPFGGPMGDINFSNSKPGDETHFKNENAKRIQAGLPPYTYYLGGRDGSFDTMTYELKDQAKPKKGYTIKNDKGYPGYFPWP